LPYRYSFVATLNLARLLCFAVWYRDFGDRRQQRVERGAPDPIGRNINGRHIGVAGWECKTFIPRLSVSRLPRAASNACSPGTRRNSNKFGEH
jgi:hypothetical protein